MPTQEEEKKFEDRIEEHRKTLYKVWNVYCTRPEDREDLVQEILFSSRALSLATKESPA